MLIAPCSALGAPEFPLSRGGACATKTPVHGTKLFPVRLARWVVFARAQKKTPDCANSPAFAKRNELRLSSVG